MFTMDVPYVPIQDTPVVLAQVATLATNATLVDYLLKTCMEGGVGGANWVVPSAVLIGELANRNREPITIEESVAREVTVKLTLLEPPAHGKLITQPPSGGRVSYQYEPEPDYVGKDKAVFIAEFAGKRYKVVYNLIVVKHINDNEPLCPPNNTLIKLQNKPASGSSGYDLNSVSVTFADLAGGAVGQAVGTTITLDTNAAGNNDQWGQTHCCPR